MPATPSVVVVTGLPRSGTSLMMQVLAAGGFPLLSDGSRRADEDNPRGYFELEAVKQTRQDSAWLSQAAGKAVKVIHLLLPDLPATCRYRLLFMQREMAEVLASQRVMLMRQGKRGAALADAQLAEVYRAQLLRVERWLQAQPNFSVLYVAHARLLADPQPVLEEVQAFLGEPLAIDRMIQAIDPSLHRQRAGSPGR